MTPLRFLLFALVGILIWLLLLASLADKAEIRVETVPHHDTFVTTTTANLSQHHAAVKVAQVHEWWAANTTTTQPRARTAPKKRPRVTRVVTTGRCGGDLPPCWVMQRESGGSNTAVNPSGCGGRGCYGKWQFDPVSFIPGCTVSKWGAGTCGTYQGYQYANRAPESVQDQRARELWAGGRGCRHWAAC